MDVLMFLFWLDLSLYPMMTQFLFKTVCVPGGFPWWLRQWRICLQCRRLRFHPWVRKISLEGEEGMATYSNILAWRIPWTEGSAGLQSMESRRVGHDWVSNTHTHVPGIVEKPFIFQIAQQDLGHFTHEKTEVQNSRVLCKVTWLIIWGIRLRFQVFDS